MVPTHPEEWLKLKFNKIASSASEDVKQVL